MPFAEQTEAAGLAPLGVSPPETEGGTPPFRDVMAAAFRRKNTIGSAAARATLDRPSPADADYDPFENISGYEPWASSFIDANSDEDVARIKRRIDQEQRRAELLESAGAMGVVADLIAGAADPVNFIPVGGEIIAAARTGARITTGALRAGRAGLLSSTVSEGLLQGTQETRTLTESAVNVAAATFLTGVMGGAVSGLAGRDIGAMAKDAMEDSNIFERELSSHYGPRSLGSAAVDTTTLEQETLVSALGAEKALSFSSPTLRTATSPAIETRRLGQELAEQPLQFKKNLEGIASPIAVETRIRQWQGPLAQSLTEVDDLFVAYRLGRQARTGDLARLAVEDAARRTPQKLTYQQFMEEVGRAMRRGDESDIAEVSRAARAMRQRLFDPLKERAIKAGLLPEDVEVTTALSYLTRVYNVDRIVAKRKSFEGILTDWLARMRDGGDGPLIGLETAELRDIARQITDKIIGNASGRVFYETVPLARGPLRERTLTIQDREIEDFLESDVRQVARAYTRTMAPDTELAAKFGRADLRDQIERIRDNYGTLRHGATSETAQKDLQKRMAGDIRDVEAIRDRLRGTYAIPDNPTGLLHRSQRLVMDLNYLRLLGGMTISALPDMGRSVMAHGIGRVFKDGIVPMVRSLRTVKLAAAEVKLAGTALDMVLDTRAMALADILDDYGRWSKFERGVQSMAGRFGVVSLMAPWNAAIKQFVGVISQTRSLQAIEKMAAGNLAKPERARLAQLGIGDEMAPRIRRMFKAHGDKQGGVWWANTSSWEDLEAVDVYRAALAKEIDAIIVTPGQERPLWMSKGMGRMIGQFRSFSVASAQRVMLAGLQKRDMATLNGAALMTGLGMLVYYLKTPDDRLSDDPAVWITEGVDRSGLTGWIFDVNNITEKFTRGAVGASRLTGGPMMTRYASRGVLESALGPTAGLVNDTAQVTGAAATGDWSEADTRAVRRMIPMQNLIGMRRLFDEAEEGVNHALGVAEE